MLPNVLFDRNWDIPQRCCRRINGHLSGHLSSPVTCFAQLAPQRGHQGSGRLTSILDRTDVSFEFLAMNSSLRGSRLTALMSIHRSVWVSVNASAFLELALGASTRQPLECDLAMIEAEARESRCTFIVRLAESIVLEPHDLAWTLSILATDLEQRGLRTWRDLQTRIVTWPHRKVSPRAILSHMSSLKNPLQHALTC